MTTAAASVRRARAKDLPRIGALGALLVETHHAFDPRLFLGATRGTLRGYAAFIGSQLDEPNAAIFVAEQGNEVLGYAYVALESYDYMSLRGPAGILHDIIVDPAARGRGVGRLLLDAALVYLKSRGAPQVVLSTAVKNEAAQRLFASVGFRSTMIEMTRDE